MTFSWRRHWPVAALEVAMLRMVVASIVATTAEVGDALRVAAGAKEHLIAPTGLQWFLRWAPLDLATATHVRTVHLGAAFLACVGLYTRPALAVLTCTSFYLFAANQLDGAVLHDMHLLWFLLILLLASPSEALSLDAWFAGDRDLPLRDRILGDPTPRLRHALAMASIGTLFGLVYLFPGAWKLGEAGLDWALSDNVVNQMHAKWFQQGVVPAPRVDHVPRLVSIGALLAIGFELSFLVLVHVGPRTRLVLVGAGLAFHLGIQHFLLIPFASLWLCYVGLVPWSTWRRAKEQGPEPADNRMQIASIALVMALLVVGLLERGIRGATQTYPLACYPTFQHRIGPSLQDLRIVAHEPGGIEREVPLARDAHGYRTQAEWGLVWSLAGVYGPAFSAPRLASYLRSESRMATALGNAESVHVSLVMRPTAPERWSEPPALVRELATLPWRSTKSSSSAEP